MLAGRSFSDHCSRVCPVLAGFVRGYNDGIGNRKRQEMRPLASHLVGTRRDLAVGRIRETMLRDWADDLWARRPARLRKLLPPLLGDSPEELGSFCAVIARTSAELHWETLAMLDEIIERLQEPDPVADMPNRLLSPV